MTTPTEHWPKPWLLKQHQLAVEHGMVWIQPISESDATSLRNRFYRVRRRSDTSMAAFIPPEYHLVTVGRWERIPENTEGLGRLPLIYSARPEGELPQTVVASGDEIAEATMPAPQLATPAIPELKLDAASLKVEEADVDDIVARLRKSARERDA